MIHAYHNKQGHKSHLNVGTCLGMFQHKHQCFNALKTLQKTRPFGMRWGHEDTVGVSTCQTTIINNFGV